MQLKVIFITGYIDIYRTESNCNVVELEETPESIQELNDSMQSDSR